MLTTERISLMPGFASALCDTGIIAGMPWGNRRDFVRSEVALGDWGFDQLKAILQASELVYKDVSSGDEIGLEYRFDPYQFAIIQRHDKVAYYLIVKTDMGILFGGRVDYRDLEPVDFNLNFKPQVSIDPADVYTRAKSFFIWAQGYEPLRKHEFVTLTSSIYQFREQTHVYRYGCLVRPLNQREKDRERATLNQKWHALFPN